MPTLYVTENGVQVHKQGQRLLVKRGTDVLQDIPIIKINRVVLMGRGVSVTTPTLYALASQQIDVLYLNSHGRYIFRLVGREHKNSRLRQSQAVSVTNASLAMRVAQGIVDAKINNQRVLVQRHAQGAPWAKRALDQMDSMRKQVVSSQNLEELRGREGLAAKEYFGLMRLMLRPPAGQGGWGFDRREYYPPPDPINALLSFGYTLLLYDLISACQISGLDPDLGYFHSVQYGKPSMALDLEEEFRPVIVDSIVLSAVNKSLFSPKDFEAGPPKQEDHPENDPADELTPTTKALALKTEAKEKPARPIFMKDDARKRFIALYEERVNEAVIYPAQDERIPYRRVFEGQAYAMSKAILGEAAGYSGFKIR